MRFLRIVVLVCGLLGGCAYTGPAHLRQRPLSREEARIVEVARAAMTADGHSVKELAYDVKRSANGWVVSTHSTVAYDVGLFRVTVNDRYQVTAIEPVMGG